MAIHAPTIYGTLGLVSADNPASCALGGFKESTSAYRHCRQCMGTKVEMKKEVELCVTIVMQYSMIFSV